MVKLFIIILGINGEPAINTEAKFGNIDQCLAAEQSLRKKFHDETFVPAGDGKRAMIITHCGWAN